MLAGSQIKQLVPGGQPAVQFCVVTCEPPSRTWHLIQQDCLVVRNACPRLARTSDHTRTQRAPLGKSLAKDHNSMDKSCDAVKRISTTVSPRVRSLQPAPLPKLTLCPDHLRLGIQPNCVSRHFMTASPPPLLSSLPPP